MCPATRRALRRLGPSPTARSVLRILPIGCVAFTSPRREGATGSARSVGPSRCDEGRGWPCSSARSTPLFPARLECFGSSASSSRAAVHRAPAGHPPCPDPAQQRTPPRNRGIGRYPTRARRLRTRPLRRQRTSEPRAPRVRRTRSETSAHRSRRKSRRSSARPRRRSAGARGGATQRRPVLPGPR